MPATVYTMALCSAAHVDILSQTDDDGEMADASTGIGCDRGIGIDGGADMVSTG
jgi:hypothetical protein